MSEEPEVQPEPWVPPALRRYTTAEAAWAAYEERHPRFESYGDLIAAHDARRASESERLTRWMGGES